MLRDMFHLNTGMFLGGTIAKLLGITLFIIVYLNCEKSKNIKKLILESIAIVIVLISKSTIALPIIVVIAFTGLLVWLWTEYENKGKLLGFFCAVAYIVIGIIIPNRRAIENTVRGDILNTMHSKLLYPFIIIFLISFSLKNEVIYKLNVQFVLMIAMIMIPECNDIFENCSVYNFVGGRAWSSVVLSLIHICI